MTTAVKPTIRARPILFSGPMVRAIFADKKTMTRRVMSPQPPDWITSFGFSCFTPTGHISGRGSYADKGPGEKFFRCKYGLNPEQLWVRETWSPDHAAFYPNFPVVYRADQMIGDWEIENGKVFSSEAKAFFPFKWRPSIFMPRCFCRIILEITSVKVERLQAITEDDAVAEGCDESLNYSARAHFARLWSEINRKRNGRRWVDNPWVWCVSFKRIATETTS